MTGDDEAVSALDELRASYDEAPFAFDHWHEAVPLSPLDGHLTPLLDGNLDRDALQEAMVDLVRLVEMKLARLGARADRVLMGRKTLNPLAPINVSESGREVRAMIASAPLRVA